MNDDFHPHPAVQGYALAIDAAGLYQNTARTYRPKIGAFLNWCQGQAIDWRTLDLGQLARFKRAIEARTTRSGDAVSGKTVNPYLVAVTEF